MSNVFFRRIDICGLTPLLGRQFFKREHWRSNHMTQGVQEQGRTLPAIEAELHFCEIGGKMFGADLMPRSDDAALQERKRGLHCVGVDVAIDVNLALVADGFVFRAVNSSSHHSFGIGRHFVGNHHVNICAYVLRDVLGQRSTFHVAGMKESQFTTTLSQADHDFFVIVRSVPSLAGALDSADIGFIHLDGAVQHWARRFFHGCSNAMTEIPSGFVGAVVLPPDRALQLKGAHTFLRFTEQEDGKEPLLQREMGIVEDRASRDRELVVAVFAVEELFLGRQFWGWHLAARALNSSGPTQPNKQLTALFVGVEQVNNVN